MINKPQYETTPKHFLLYFNDDCKLATRSKHINNVEKSLSISHY